MRSDGQTCPVCGKEGLPLDAQQCPQCDADLSCFQALNKLSGEEERSQFRPVAGRKILWFGVALFFSLFIGEGIWFRYQDTLFSKTLANNQIKLEKYQGSVVELEKRYDLQEKERQYLISTITAKKEEIQRKLPPFFWYKPTDSDTLWSISKYFYGQGYYYPVLLAMNPGINIYEIGEGEQLKILKEKEDVIATFRSSIKSDDSSTYFLYYVQAGDTMEKLSQKFYKTPDQCQVIQKANPTVSLEPGQEIKILLLNFKGKNL
ncbi:MAG: LysM peptidoglycan-binding domain-containing protein [bacterium]